MADDPVLRAAAELYAGDPSQFIDRRKELAAAARQAGAAEAAKQIAALRRPTRAAWVLNRLSGTDPHLAGQFAELGDQLRTAHVSLDGAALRELSKQRRQLIDHTAAAAFKAAAIATPTAALREEVTATLGAVLADPDVAARFRAAMLVSAEDQSGFGPTGPVLTSVPTLVAVASAADDTEAEPGPARPSAREVRRQKALAAGQEELVAAEQAHDDAIEAGDAATAEVRRLSDQLADARRREDDALLDVRRAESRVRKAREALAALERLDAQQRRR